MRRSDHPSRPSAITCSRFSALKTLAIPAAGAKPTAHVNVSAPGAALAGFQVSINGRFWVSTEGWSVGPLWWVLWQQSEAGSGARKMYELCMQAKGYELRGSPDRRATASSSPTPAQFESVVSEQKAFFARVRAERERDWSQPVACGGAGAFPSLNNYILALTPWAE